MKYLILIIAIIFNIYFIYTQPIRKCGTEEPDFVPILQHKSRILLDDAICIPIVVHVIWNNAEQNISDSQILSQINVMNEDYRRMPNTPGFNNDQRGSDTRYEFRLANRDPSGNATNGITRHYSNQTTFNYEDNNHITTLINFAFWDRDRYLNIWIVPILTNNNSSYVFGKSYFPWYNYDIDGTIIRSSYFGDNVGSVLTNYYDQFRMGRTSTHETGHYLGLLHTFQGGCLNSNCNTQGDNVCDTPPVYNPTFGCPTGRNSCNTDNPDLNDMIENYMDYSDDDCMNIFTNGQTDRMDDNFWTYRSDLETSNGLTNNDFILFGEHQGNYDYNNTTRIVSQSNATYSAFTIDNGNSVILRSREQIVLNSGFRASNGSFFRSFIDPNLPAFPKRPESNLLKKSYNADLIIIPNPSNSITKIRYSISDESDISMYISNIFGTNVMKLMPGSIRTGENTYDFDVSALPSGIYFLTLKSGGESITKQFAVVR